jgi:hypothetical protein
MLSEFDDKSVAAQQALCLSDHLAHPSSNIDTWVDPGALSAVSDLCGTNSPSDFLSILTDPLR